MATEQRTLPHIDQALDAARAKWDHGDAPYAPEILALIRAAESMRAQLYGSHRDDVDPQPVFVIQAKDQLAIAAVSAYRRLCEERGLDGQAEQVRLAAAEMSAWRERNPGAVKLPGHTHVPALPHAADMAPLLGRLFEQDAAAEEAWHEFHDGPWSGQRVQIETSPDAYGHLVPHRPEPGIGEWVPADAHRDCYVRTGSYGETTVMTWRQSGRS